MLMKEDSDLERTFQFRIPNHVTQVYLNFSVKLEGAVQSLLYHPLASSSSADHGTIHLLLAMLYL